MPTLSHDTSTDALVIELDPDEIPESLLSSLAPPCAEAHCENARMCLQYDQPVPESHPIIVLERWHNDDSGHAGAFRFCDVEPCRAMRDSLEGFIL